MSRADVVPFNVPSETAAPLFFVSVEDPKRLAEEAQARVYRAQALADALGKVSECDSATALPAFARVMAGMLAEVEQLLDLAGSAGARRDHGTACACGGGGGGGGESLLSSEAARQLAQWALAAATRAGRSGETVSQDSPCTPRAAAQR